MQPQRYVRKLTRLGSHSYYVVLPPPVIRALGWHERQKLVVRQTRTGVRIDDWPRARQGT